MLAGDRQRDRQGENIMPLLQAMLRGQKDKTVRSPFDFLGRYLRFDQQDDGLAVAENLKHSNNSRTQC